MGKPKTRNDIDRDIYEFLMAVRNSDINAVMKIMRRHGYTDLHFAVIECKVGKIRRLLENGVDSNTKHEADMTPLHYAAEYCPEAIPLLIKHGADPYARDEGGLTPLHIATLKGSIEAVKALIHTDVNVRDNKNRTPLHLALEYGHCDAALLLLQHGADINAADSDGRTPLHLAAGAGCVEAVKLLLQYVAGVNVRDSKNNTVLHYAVKSLNKDVVDLVLKSGMIDVNAKNVYGETPLKLLVRECARWDSQRRRCYEVAKLLVERGADPNIRDSRGTSPMDSAKLIGFSELVELFRSR